MISISIIPYQIKEAEDDLISLLSFMLLLHFVFKPKTLDLGRLIFVLINIKSSIYNSTYVIEPTSGLWKHTDNKTRLSDILLPS